MSHTYSDVDASADPAGAVDWQERMAAWPGVRAYKRRTHEVLEGARSVVDIGCGPGVDIVDLGRRSCVGVEPSVTMAAAASARGAVVCRADAHDLPFPDGAFGGARADRVLQHLSEPLRAVRELVRVVEPGGRIAIADPDQGTLAIEVPGVRRSVLERLEALRRDIGYRNGTLIAQVPAVLGHLGVDDVSVDAYPLVITDPQRAFGLPTWPDAWRAEGRFTDQELEEWHRAMDDTRDGFLYTVTFLVVGGTKKS